MNEAVTYLVVSEDPALLEQVRVSLTRAGLPWAGQRVRAVEDVRAALAGHLVRLCVVEDRAASSLRQFPRMLPADVLLVMICDPARESLGVEAMEAGFADYLLRDNLTRLGSLARRWVGPHLVSTDAGPAGQEARFREVFQSTSDAIAFFEVLRGRRFVLEGLNPAAERLLGVCSGDVVGTPVQELLPSPVGETVLRGFQRAIESGTTTATEQCWELPSGTRWLHVLHVPSRHAGLPPHRLAAIWRDITDHKSYEKALIDREEMFRRLVETTNVIPWEAQFQSARFTYIGPQVVKRFGYPSDEWLRDGFWAEHIHPEDRARAVEVRSQLSSTASEYEFEYRMVTRSGEVVWVRDLMNVVLDLHGRLLLRGFFVDVTARRQAEEECRRLNTELERRVIERTGQLAAANRELEAFSYSVSHDLRAPLRAIDGFSKALLEDYSQKLDEDGQDMLLRVRAASQRMGELIDDLLLLSRVSRSEMRARRVDLSELVGSIAAALARDDPHRQVEWSIEPGLIAVGDPALLRVVLENLLENAWKYTRKSPGARIEFGRCGTGDEEEFFIRDNGVGFDATYAAKLFQPFQRLHDSEEFEGHGIGLATVQRIIHRHRGRVRAEGAVGKGATFYFTL